MRTEETIISEQARNYDRALFCSIVRDAKRFPIICKAIYNDGNKLYDSTTRASSYSHYVDGHQFYYRWEKKDDNMISFDFASINSKGNLFAKHLTVSEKLAKRALAEIELAATI